MVFKNVFHILTVL